MPSSPWNDPGIVVMSIYDVVAVSNGEPVALPVVVVIDARTGKERWRVPLDSGTSVLGGQIVGSTIVLPVARGVQL